MIQQPLHLIRGPVPGMPAILHPFTRGSPPASAATYLPACSHTCVRAKHGRSPSSSSARSRSASPVLILTAAAAFGSVVFTHT